MATFELNVLNFLILSGAVQGIILAIILVTTPRLIKVSNFYLALLLLSFAITSIGGTFEDMYLQDQYPIIGYLPFFWFSPIPFTLYLFIRNLTDAHFTWKWQEFLFLVFILVELLMFLSRLGFYLSGHPYSPDQDQQFFAISHKFQAVTCLANLGVIWYGVKIIRGYEIKLLDSYAEIEGKSLSWLKNTLISGVFLCIWWLALTLFNIKYGPTPEYISYGLRLGLSVMIYWIGYSMLIQQGILDSDVFGVVDSVTNEANNSAELSIKTEEHFRHIISLMEKDKIYLNPDLNMNMLSQETGLSNGYLSQIINQKQKQNFFDFINNYRVEHFKKQLGLPQYSHFSLFGLAQESGFKSKSTFNAVFKKSTGKTPSEYRNSL